jgi:hypothetical protein
MADVYKAVREGVIWRMSSGKSALQLKEGQTVTLGLEIDENDLKGDTTGILVKQGSSPKGDK